MRHAGGLWALVGAALVVSLLLGVSRAQRTPTLELLPGIGARPKAARPPRELSLRPNAKDRSDDGATFHGFAEEQTAEGRRTARMIAPRATVTFSLDPDPAAVRLSVGARVADAASGELRIEMNGQPAGGVEVTAILGFASVDVPGSQLLAGPNELALLSPSATIIDTIEVDPLSARLELDTRTPEGRAALGDGWRLIQEHDQRTGVHLGHATGSVAFRLSPLEADYTLVVGGNGAGNTRTATIAASVNGVAMGTFQLSDALGAALLPVPRDRMVTGENRVELAAISGPDVAVEQIFIEPVVERLRLDMGTLRARAYLEDGFSSDEPCEPGACTWSSGPRSVLRLWLRPREGTYQLRFSAHALAPIAPLVVDLRVNGEPVGAVTVKDRFALYAIAVPPGKLREGENLLELAYGRTAEPRALMAGSSDSRELAVRYDWLELTPGRD